MILHTIMDRGDNYKYLNSELKLDEFEGKGYEEWYKTQPVLKNIYIYIYIYIYI